MPAPHSCELAWVLQRDMCFPTPVMARAAIAITAHNAFCADIRVASFEKDADVTFWTLSAISLFLFFFEFLAFSLAKPGYLFSFYFWLDLIATLSLIPDIGFIDVASIFSGDDGDVGSADQARAGRAARAGTRAGRVVRIIRLVRLVRIMKLYKQLVERMKGDSKNTAQVSPDGENFVLGGGDSAISGEDSEPSKKRKGAEVSKVGAALSEKTTRVVILLILLMLFVVPFLDDTGIDITLQVQPQDLSSLHRMPQTAARNASESVFRLAVEDYARYTGRIAFISVCNENSQCANKWPDATLFDWLSAMKFVPEPDGTGEAPAPGVSGVDTNPITDWDASMLFRTEDAAKDKLRDSEITEYSFENCFNLDGTIDSSRGENCKATVVYDNRHITRQEAVRSIGKTWFVIAVIGIGAFLFTRDAEALVIRPIQRMSRLITALARDPMRSIDSIKEEVRLAELEDDERKELEEAEDKEHQRQLRRRQSTVGSLNASGFQSVRAVDWKANASSGKSNKRLGVPDTVREDDGDAKPKENCMEIVQHKSSSGYSALANCINGKKKSADSYETALLENTMLKIGGLLQVGFGQAGGAIIRKNMQTAKDGKLNPLVKGAKIDAVYGFCDIRQFTDTTECLQEDVMVFVNQIGQIVHSSTHRLEGAANKNIGDAFLLTWKLPKVTRRGRSTDPTAPNRRGGKPGMGSNAAHNGSWHTSGANVSPRVRNSLPPIKAAFDEQMTDASQSLTTAAHTPDAAILSQHSMDMTSLLDTNALDGWAPDRSAMMEVEGQFDPDFVSPDVPVNPGKTVTIIVFAVDGATAADDGSMTASPVSRADMDSGAGALALAAAPPSPEGFGPAGGAPPRHGRSPATRGGSSNGSTAPPAIATSPGRVNVSTRRGSAIMLSPMALEAMQDTSDKTGSSPADEKSDASDEVSDTSDDSSDGEHSSAAVQTALGIAASPDSKRGRTGSLDANTAAGIRAEADTHKAHTGAAKAPSRASMPPVVGGRKLLADGPSSPGAHTPNSVSPARRSIIPRRASSMSQGHNPHIVSRTADNALAAFLKMMVDIFNSNERGDLNQYRHDPRIISRMGPEYGVKMGFGLHIGWAIEGAIGSAYKVDASYLSPHVNMAARLEAATKQYGVPLLISRDFAQELTPAAQKYLRLLDRVTVKGSEHPMELYTFDVSFYPSQFGDAQHNIEPRNAAERKALKTAAEPPIHIDFATDPAVLALQAGLPDGFFEAFEAGVQAYLGGQWPTARLHLQEVLDHWKPNDGPSNTLLGVMSRMSQEDGSAPAAGEGCRALTEKCWGGFAETLAGEGRGRAGKSMYLAPKLVFFFVRGMF